MTAIITPPTYIELPAPAPPFIVGEPLGIRAFELTAYTSGYESTQKKPGEVGYGITASGEQAQEGVTAACPPSMAFGTVIEIDGMGERICQDRGGAITEGHIDVYMGDLKDAIKFGRQKRNVRIMKEDSK
jgi:3D (Asp-Asp-Asp) domain-containing protein